ARMPGRTFPLSPMRLVFQAGAKRQGPLAHRLMALGRFSGQEFGQELRSLAIRQHAAQARRYLHEFGRSPVGANFAENREGHGKVGKATLANHPARVFHYDGSKHSANFPARVVLDWSQPFAGHADSPRQSIGRELFLHDELLERGHDPLAVVDRQTNFARREPFKPFLDLHLRPLDFAKFVGSLDRHRPFHRRLPQVGDFHETVLVKICYSPSPQSFCRSLIISISLLFANRGAQHSRKMSQHAYMASAVNGLLYCSSPCATPCRRQGPGFFRKTCSRSATIAFVNMASNSDRICSKKAEMVLSSWVPSASSKFDTSCP